MKKVLLLNDTENVYHWGCYGTSSALKEQLNIKGIEEIDPICVYSIHRMQSIPSRIEDFPNKEEFINIYPDLALRIQNCDGVIINGEGTIHHFGNGTRTLLFLSYVAKRFFHKKVFLINHSCYPYTRDQEVIAFYKAGYQSCDFIAARERRSALLISDLFGVNCVLAFDSLPLHIRRNYNAIPDNLFKSPYICISGGVNYRHENSAVIAKRLLSAFPYYQYIYLSGSKEGSHQEDTPVYDSLRQHLPNLGFFDAKTFLDWMSVIKHSHFLISGRFHYTIAALCLGTKSIYFQSNTPKIDEVAKEFKLRSAIPLTPSWRLEALLWYQLKSIENNMNKNFLEEFCARAMKNYVWDI